MRFDLAAGSRGVRNAAQTNHSQVMPPFPPLAEITTILLLPASLPIA
jgi:hypothetical protein